MLARSWVFLALAYAGVLAPGPAKAGATCYVTGGGDLRVCHDAGVEGVYDRPSALQLGYNAQIIALGNGRLAVVMHSEARDSGRYRQLTGRNRPGDSVKAGLVNTQNDPRAAFAAPPDLEFRIWGSLTNPASPLYYAIDKSDPAAIGVSGGGNPMTIRGRDGRKGAYFYTFFLGVTSDGGLGRAWRNVLLEARTRDFQRFDVLQTGRNGAPAWVKFAGDQARPALVRDTSGRAIVSNRAAKVETGGAEAADRPAGAVVTSGLIGSIVYVAGRYDYFYTDQDPVDPARAHLYLRTASDIGTNFRWSPPRIVMDVPPEVLIRVAKARDMARWTVFYSCLRSARPKVYDVCLQYTENLKISGPGSLSALRLFDGPVYDGVSGDALGLTGGGGTIIKAQQYYLTDADGNLTAPPGSSAQDPRIGGMLTWTDLPPDFDIFGAPIYWGEWTVTPVSAATH